MKQNIKIFSLLFFNVIVINVYSQISGTVYRDYNFNGTRQTTNPIEPLVDGVTVRATLANGTVVAKTTSGTTAPNYSFTSGEVGSSGAVRIEFVINNSFDQPSVSATSGTAFNSTNVQIVTAGAGATNVNFAVNNPGDYSANTNPLVVVPWHLNGASQHFTNFGQAALLGVNYNGTGTIQGVATTNQIGATWGVAYKPKTRTIFAAAVLRRHIGFGPGADNIINTADDISAIYVINNYSGSGAGTISSVINLNSFAGVNVGANPRLGTTPANDLGASTSPSHDYGVYGNEGKIGIGDIDVSENGDTLYVLNLNSKQLVLLNVVNPNSPTLIGAYTIPTPPGSPAGDSYRPWAIGVDNGKVYVGGVSTADVSQNVANLRAYVQQFTGTGFVTVDIDATTANDFINLNYNRTGKFFIEGAGAPAEFSFWQDVEATTFNSSIVPRAQPILSDIDFSANGSMSLNFIDRTVYQKGNYNYAPSAANTTLYTQMNAGELRQICNTGTLNSPVYVPEGAAGSCFQNILPDNRTDPSGPPARRFFNTISLANQASGSYTGHGEIASGGHAQNKAINDLIMAGICTFDIQSGGSTPTSYFSNGLRRLNASTGAITGGLNIFTTESSSTTTSTLSKSTGLGDLELLNVEQPIQIGNRIWLDSNVDGLQDPTETTPGVPTGTTVTLRSPGADGIYSNGDDQTWTTTTDANGNYYFGTLSTPDNRKPASWTGIGNNILPGYDYRIEVVRPASHIITQANIGGNDNIDNDAVSNGINAVVIFNTGNTNHNFDIGFATASALPIRLISFTAQPQNTTVVLNWVVEAEVNVANYVVEHSNNGVDFNDKGTVSAFGSRNYSLVDNLPIQGLNYYRLKIIDKNGQISYSEIRKVNFGKGGIVSVYPNPSNSVVNITVTNGMINKTGTITLITIDGKIVALKQVAALSQTETIDIKTLPSGKYILRIVTNTEIINNQIEVVK